MRTMKKGFTLIEVMLFLVLTGALFVLVAVGTQNSIFQQRYNDSINNFVEFFRGMYSQVSNVENQGDGRSDKAIYGKLITFGEEYDLSENLIEGRSPVFTYDVIGDVGDIGTGDALDALKYLNANVFIEENGLYSTGMAGSYVPRWGARIEKPSGHENFEGSILIVRHPRSGTILTYISDKTIQVNGIRREQNNSIRAAASEDEKDDILSSLVNPLKGELSSGSFRVDDINFCINPYGDEVGRMRTNVRLIKKARNASGIVLPAIDGDDNSCAE